MASSEGEQRLTWYREVISVLQEQDEFESNAVKTVCEAVTPRFVTGVLKRLTADSVISQMSSPARSSKSKKFVWLENRLKFDADGWIEKQLSGGTQVSQAPKEERPRERLLEHGAASLKNGELLAILIRSGLRGESAVQAGQRLAAHFEGRMEKLPGHSTVELKKISRAVSDVAYCQIMAGIELGRRVAEEGFKKEPIAKINSTNAAIAFCTRHFGRLAHDSQQEEFHIVTLDTKLQPIQTHQITVGTLDASLVHPREVFRAAIRDASSSILLVHNHPSGDPTPSRQDHQVTERLKKCGEMLGITVIDHIIVAKNDAVSLADWG